MRAGAVGVAFVLLVAAGCSDDDDPPSATDVPVATDAPDATDPPATSTTEPAPSTTEPTPPTTEPGPSTTDSAPSTTEPAPSTTDRPTVINDVATVEDGRCDPVARGVSEFSLEGGGATRDVRVFVPDTLLAEPAPVVFDFHGLGGNGPQQAAYSGYEDLAASEGFVVVHPTGVDASWELPAFDDPDRDDVEFVDVLIDTVVADWCGDPDRVYSTGFSNGGFFTARLICDRADRIAAAVSVGGLGHPDGCDPARPVPFIAYHGTDDAIVPFDGDGDSPLANVDGASSTFFTQVMPDEFAEFAAAAGCSPTPERTEVTDEVVRHDYVECDGGVPMTFFELPGSGHTWPGSPLADQVTGLGRHATDVDATVDGWAFLSGFSL